MIEQIYIEAAVRDHPRTLEICARYPKATLIDCERYGEVFNTKAQSFRLQKQNPALILARKHKGFVLEAPSDYGIGGAHNYYFSHMLNCLYDCRYCFLQGMYRSAHYVVFVNYEDFGDGILEQMKKNSGAENWFYSGYDCDSLALEPVTHFNDFILPLFKNNPLANLEIRTKSTQVRGLLKTPALENVVVAFSFTPHAMSEALEHKVPSVEKRLASMLELQKAGWKIGLRFDPVIYSDEYKTQYSQLFERIFSILDVSAMHSVSLGTFRLPRDFYKRLVTLYPTEPLFAGPLDENAAMVTYHESLAREMMDFCHQQLRLHVPEQILFPCTHHAA